MQIVTNTQNEYKIGHLTITVDNFDLTIHDMEDRKCLLSMEADTDFLKGLRKVLTHAIELREHSYDLLQEELRYEYETEVREMEAE